MTLVLIGKGLVLGGLTFKNRGHLGSIYKSRPMDPSWARMNHMNAWILRTKITLPGWWQGHNDHRTTLTRTTQSILKN